MAIPFQDRQDAGRQLAALLGAWVGREDLLVLALPRGGVPVGYEVAEALGALLDVFLVRKLGVPGYEELAMGAIASGGVVVLNQGIIRSLGVHKRVVESVIARERRELGRRERLYRGERGTRPVPGRMVFLVDDGLATGSTMWAAVEALRKMEPAGIVVAVPVAAAPTCEEFRGAVTEVVCAFTPEPFHAVGLWYREFAPTTDLEVRQILDCAVERAASRGSGSLARAPGTPEAGGEFARPAASFVDTVRSAIQPWTGARADHDRLLERIGDARFVLIGGASHGTREFYEARAEITKRLIETKRFQAVAVEADWPDAYRVNRFVRGAGNDGGPEEALRDFRRFPQWMWRNRAVLEFVEWLRRVNDGRPFPLRVGFYGLDLYSLHRSIDAVLAYLDAADPEAAARARSRYRCFDHFGEDAQAYGRMTRYEEVETCEEEVVSQLLELERQSALLDRRGRLSEDDALFNAEQNARLVRNAEAYYRSMFRGRISSWNLRDRHMAETLAALAGRLGVDAAPARVVVWAHNSHLGDARATFMGTIGELNLGQLVRERYPGDCHLLGMTTHRGTVSAAPAWGAPVARMRIHPSLPGSYERLFHDVETSSFLLDLQADGEAARGLREPRLQRAIGVVYLPETERFSHYFESSLGRQFDSLLHMDETTAVEPLERTAEWDSAV